jgi:hypothetical protein
MNDLNREPNLKKQVEMYFDQALDPTTRDEFLHKVNTDPDFQQAFAHEQSMRNQLKAHVYRPDNSSQLIKAIKNQIRKD